MDFQRSTDISSAPSVIDPKAFGAYYTGESVADFLAWWAIRNPSDSVIDPSFGDGAFLLAACKRLRELDGDIQTQVYGVEIDSEVHRVVSADFAMEFGIHPSNLVNRDFFDFDPPENRFDAVIGNPPFIRYHRFTSDTRRRALSRAARSGVKLTQLSSSWAPFVIHSAAMLKEDGRLAFVLPAELTHAAYARPVLDHLTGTFRKVTILTFKKRLFPHLNEDTVLLLAAGRGGSCTKLLHRDVSSSDELNTIRNADKTELRRTRGLPVDEIVSGRRRVIERNIRKSASDLYHRLRQEGSALPLRKFADVGIGYVTGANDFFHLSEARQGELQIPGKYLKRAVRKTRVLRGTTLTPDDWFNALDSGDGEYLFHVGSGSDLPPPVLDYIASGEAKGVHNAYKCRVRNPWYAVPNVTPPDAFLTYMSGLTPRLVVNDARAVAPNTLHLVRMHTSSPCDVQDLSVLWLTSLTRLSVEIEGHSLGGGMLKIEPTEAESCLLANPGCARIELQNISVDVNQLLRQGHTGEAYALVDNVILGDLLGLDETERNLLKDAAELLRRRRYER